MNNYDQVAFFWEGNDPENEGKITYSELLVEVCKFANVLKAKGVQKVITNLKKFSELVSSPDFDFCFQ